VIPEHTMTIRSNFFGTSKPSSVEDETTKKDEINFLFQIIMEENQPAPLHSKASINIQEYSKLPPEKLIEVIIINLILSLNSFCLVNSRIH